METFEQIERETSEEDNHIEFSDLDMHGDIAQGQSFPGLHRRRSTYRRHWRLASSLSFLLLLVILLSLSNLNSSPILRSFKTVFFPPSLSSSSAAVGPMQDGIACLADAAWSPDSRYIAVLGYHHCPKKDYALGLVNLYDARSRKLVNQVVPDTAIESTLDNSMLSPKRQFGNQPMPQDQRKDAAPLIYYAHIIWSPDGQHLALTFELAAQWLKVHGVVLMNRGGGDFQVLLQNQTSRQSYHEWNVGSNRPIALNTPSLPPALDYHWGAGGKLVSETLLSNNELPAVQPRISEPVGNPDGNNSFTIWQGGLANIVSLVDTSNTSVMYTWSTDFAAWSPDRRYLIDGIALNGLLKPPGQLFPSSKALVSLGLTQASLLPIHDAALLTAIDGDTAIAWTPNGRVLAAYNAKNVVNLYDCTDGHKLSSFSIHKKYAAPDANAMVLRWSPDGSHLLLSSVTWGLISIVDAPLQM